MHNKYHLFDIHRACASFSMRHLFLSFFFFFFSFSIFFLFFFYFSLAPSLCQQLYKITIWDSALTTFARNSTRYQMCIAQAIIGGTSLNRCLLNAKIVYLTKENKWGEVVECLYLSSPIFTLYWWIPPWSWNLYGLDIMNHGYDDAELLLLFETS